MIKDIRTPWEIDLKSREGLRYINPIKKSAKVEDFQYAVQHKDGLLSFRRNHCNPHLRLGYKDASMGNS